MSHHPDQSASWTAVSRLAGQRVFPTSINVYDTNSEVSSGGAVW
jgi:hypothetical protein